MIVDQLPDESCKTDESYATESGARCVKRSSSRSTPYAVESGSFLFFDFVFLDQCHARRKDRGKGQEEAAYARSIAVSD